MSQRDDLKDMLFEQLADLEIFERLLRFDPARQKLFLCLATLISRGKPLASQIKETYTERYKQQPADDVVKAQTTTLNLSSTATSTTKTASKLAKLARAKLALNCKNPLYEQTFTSTSSTTTPATLMASTSRTSASSAFAVIKSLDEAIFEEADSMGLTDDIENEFSFGLDVIDFGLRLGSFLSEAGWLSESIKILTCVATKLKRMILDKKLKIIYLDCLQR